MPNAQPSAFSKRVQEAAPKPPGLVVLKPEHFLPEWHLRPRADVAVGVRTLSEVEIHQVTAEAARDARLYYPDADEDDELLNRCFEDTVVAFAAGRAACSPNDSREQYFRAPDEMVRSAWPAGTIRRVWDELERATVSTSPVAVPADDADLRELGALLAKGHAGRLAPTKELRLRKMLAFALDELRAVEGMLG